MYCSKCGSLIEGKFCTNCGNPVKEVNSFKECTTCGTTYSDKFCPNGCNSPSFKNQANNVNTQNNRCIKCGTSYTGRYCPNGCNSPFYSQPSQQSRTSSQSIRCPRCGGTNLQILNEVHSKGVSGTKVCLFGICGLCGAGKTSNQAFWVCQSCGNRFKL